MAPKDYDIVTGNPWLNFLRHIRRMPENEGLSAIELAKKGSQMWCRMSDEKRQPFRKMARYEAFRRREELIQRAEMKRCGEEKYVERDGCSKTSTCKRPSECGYDDIVVSDSINLPPACD